MYAAGSREECNAADGVLSSAATNFLAVMAEGSHPFPFRTRPLSPPAPMVLPRYRGGRVGRCQEFFRRPGISRCRAFFFFSSCPEVLAALICCLR